MGGKTGYITGPLQMAAGAAGEYFAPGNPLSIPLMTGGLGQTAGTGLGGSRGGLMGELGGAAAGGLGEGFLGMGPLGSSLGGTQAGQSLQGSMQGTGLGNFLGVKPPAPGALGSSVAAGVTPTPVGAPGAFPSPGAPPIPQGAGGAAGSAMPLGDISREIASQGMTGSPGALPSSNALSSQLQAAQQGYTDQLSGKGPIAPGTPAPASGDTALSDIAKNPLTQMAAGPVVSSVMGGGGQQRQPPPGQPQRRPVQSAPQIQTAPTIPQVPRFAGGPAPMSAAMMPQQPQVRGPGPVPASAAAGLTPQQLQQLQLMGGSQF